MRIYQPIEKVKEDSEKEEYLSSYISKTIKSNFASYVIGKYGAMGGRLLDCGTGSGAFSEKISGYEIYGADLRDYRQEKTKPLYKDFRAADFNLDKIDYPDNFFDIITAWCVIPHLENPYNFIREIHRILRLGGIFVFTFPNIESLSHRKFFYKTGEMINYSHKNDHITIWTNNIAKKVLGHYFKEIGREYFVKDKVFRGLKGKVKKWLCDFGMQQRYASKTAFIMKK